MGPFFHSIAPFAEALLRVVVGLALVPHGLRNTFGLFPNTGVHSHTIAQLAQQLDHDGYWPGAFWAPAIALTQLVGGPLLAIGLMTRPVAAVVLLFLIITNIERWRVGKYFWNKLGIEYTLMWAVAVFYVLVYGPGPYSVDHWLGIPV